MDAALVLVIVPLRGAHAIRVPVVKALEIGVRSLYRYLSG